MLRFLPIIKVLAVFIGNMVNVIVSIQKNERQQSVNSGSRERQQSINYVGCCISYNPRAVLRHLPLINVLAAFVGKREGDMVTALV